ncbi:MAG: ATP-binding cassette domain-containing protein [Candidatus Peribacteria bacterium]|nr:ATP-binding cassette domain-containing protein [Candidatus Peribacteria bacterium]
MTVFFLMLTVRNVSKSFNIRKKSDSKFRNFFHPEFEKFPALKSISFHVNQGEKVAFIGPNGAGKSTMIKSILGILHYDVGEIAVFGQDPKKERKAIAKQTSSVFGQRSQLLYHLPLIDSFNFFRIIYDIPKDVFQERLDGFVKKF